MKIYFVYKKIITGGCELLIERLSKELKNRLIPVSIIFQSIDQNMQSRYSNAGIQLLKVNSWNRKNVISCLDSEEAYFITFVWNDFLICNIKSKYIHTVFYAVHYQAYEMGRNKPIFIKKMLKRIAKKGIVTLNNNRQLLCMDEQTVEYTNTFYKYNTIEIPILRLAIDTVPEVIRKIDKSKIDILTIARAEFPFKGYILGLLDWFASSDANIRLTIVSYGPDEKKIADRIDSFDEIVKKRITLVGKTDYGQLEKYYQTADLYVGMGTTVLDASMRGIVAIPVQAYTLDLITDRFFYEDFRKIAIDQGSKTGFNKLLQQYRRLESEGKNELSKKSRDAVIDNYSSSAIVDELVHILESTKNNCSTIGLELMQFYHEIKTAIKGD